MRFDEDRRAVLSKSLKDDDALGHLHTIFAATQGRSLTLPERFAPDDDALAYHRERIFESA